MSRGAWAAAVAAGLALAHVHLHVTAAEVLGPALVAVAVLAALGVALGRLVAADMRAGIRAPAPPARPARPARPAPDAHGACGFRARR